MKQKNDFLVSKAGLEEWEKEMKNRDIIISSVRGYNEGTSNYSAHKIQPWDIWMEYHLNPWDADIVKGFLESSRKKEKVLKSLESWTIRR